MLEDTLAGILDRYPALATVACVPLGVSRFSNEAAMRPHTRDEAAAVCDAVERWQGRSASALGRRMVFAADEYYLMAERPFPPAATYEGFPQHENGIGMARAFEAAFGGDERAALGVRPGSSPPSTGPRPRATGPVAPPRRAGTSGGGRPIAILTGEYGARVLGTAGRRSGPGRHPTGAGRQRLLRRQHRCRRPADRRGPRRVAATAQPEGHRYLLPDACLYEGRFLDDLTLADLPRPVEVVPTDGLSLRRALESAGPVTEPVPTVGRSERVPVTLGPR